MAGIEKITDQIIEEAKLSAASKVENARKEAGEILENARQECLKMEAEASEKEENLKKTHESRVKSSADQQRKRALLQAKQEIIKEVIDEAYRELKSQDSNSYFQTIEKLVKTYALPESGEIYFSKKDLSRMPQNFSEKIEKAAKESGGTLKLMKEARQIEDGFILVYGGIEENCTFRALLDAKKDQLQDQVNRILFM